MMNKINRFLYENSVVYQTYLIIPYIAYRINSQNIYSYSLLAEQGYKNELHQVTNPAKLYSNYLDDLLNVAKEHLDTVSDQLCWCAERNRNNNSDNSLYFYQRYIYNQNLIVLHQQAEKCFYDHYPPDELRNIAAPKLFNSAFECLNWVKKGLDRHKVN